MCLQPHVPAAALSAEGWCRLGVQERVASAEQRLARKEAATAELKGELARAKEALLTTTRASADEYSARMQGEMLRWQAAAKSTSDAQAEAHSAEVNTHKDARELAVAEAEKWHARYEMLKQEHDAAVLAAAEAAGRAEAAQAELRAEAKLKTFEVERLRLQCEQALVSARQAHVDVSARPAHLRQHQHHPTPRHCHRCTATSAPPPRR